MILELAFIMCFDCCEILNPFVPPDKKMFWFYSVHVNNEVSTELFILSVTDFFFASVSTLIQFKM